MLGTIADHIMACRHRLGRHVLFTGSAVRIPPTELPVAQILQNLAREQVEESFQNLPSERRGSAALEQFAQQVPDHAGRCQLLQAKLADARPTEGHTQLARLVKDGYFSTIFITEPDMLLEESLSSQHMEPESDYHLLVGGVDDPKVISVALEESSRMVVVKCGGDLESKYLPLTADEIAAGLAPIRPILDRAFRVMVVFTAYDDRDKPFIEAMPPEGSKVFWVNRQVPVADEEMYTQLKLENPSSIQYHRLQPEVIQWLQARQSQRHLLVREKGSFNDFFAQLYERFQHRKHASRQQHKDLNVLRGGPYRFLDYFDIEDSEFFFGREQQITDLIELIKQQSLTVLFGRSGIGKTSLIKAGVIARLQGRDEEHLEEAGTWLPIYARCEDDPAISICRAAVKVADEHGCDVSDIDHYPQLHDLLTHLAKLSKRRLVVFLDQAEELFVKLGGRVRDNFISQIKECLDDQQDNLRVVLSIREDYVGELYELRGELPQIMQNVYRLRKLDRLQAEKAIVQPAVNFGLQVERKLVDQLLEDLAREGVEPAQLQVVCHRLYEEMSPGARVITQSNYQKLGRSPRILHEYLDYALRQLPILERHIARAILKQMAVSSELKATRSLDRIAQEVHQDKRAVERVLAKMVDYRLVRGLGKDRYRNYELVHEQLAEQVDEWVSEDELKLRDVQDLLTRELNNFKKFGLLMGSEAVHIIDDHRDELSISPEEMELILRSVALHDIEAEYWFSRADELGDAITSVLASLLTDEFAEVRRTAYLNLEDNLDEALIPALVKGLDDKQREVHQYAHEYLQSLKRQLHTWLRDGDHHQQLSAAQALGRIAEDDQRSISALIRALSDDNPELTDHISRDLRRINSPQSLSTLTARITSEADPPWAVAYTLGQVASADDHFAQLQKTLRNNQRTAQLHYALARAQILRREFDEAQESLQRAQTLSSTETARQHINQAQEIIRATQQQDTQADYWAMFGGSPQHGAFTPQALVPPLEELWSVRTGDSVVASPVVADHTVYIGSRDGTFYALDSQQGHTRWTYEVGERIEGTAAVAGDLIVFGAGDSRLHALDGSNGSPQWQRPLNGAIRSVPTVQDDQLFVGDGAGSLWAIDWSSGEVNWQVSTKEEIVAAPAVADGLVVVGSWDNGLYAVRSADGEVQWRLDSNGPIASAPTIAESTVFCGSDDFCLYAVDLASGNIRWQVQLGGMIRSSPAVAGQQLVVGCGDGNVYCLDVTNGEQIWRYETGEEVLASAAITGDVVYIGSRDGILYAFDLSNGEVKWQHPTIYAIYSAPAIAETTLYIGIDNYYVSAFAPQ